MNVGVIPSSGYASLTPAFNQQNIATRTYVPPANNSRESGHNISGAGISLDSFSLGDEATNFKDARHPERAMADVSNMPHSQMKVVKYDVEAILELENTDHEPLGNYIQLSV